MENITLAISNGSTSFQVAEWARMCYGTYLILVTLVGVPGNIVVVIVYGKTVPKTACDWLILTMGITDAVVCFFSPGLYFRTEFQIDLPWMHHAMCIMEQWLHLTAMVASCMILVVIAVDRYVKICRPRLPSLSPVRARNVAVLCLIFSSALCVFPAIEGVTAKECTHNQVRLRGLSLGYFMVLFIWFVLSFVIVTFAYISVCRQIGEKVKIKLRLMENDGLVSSKHSQDEFRPDDDDTTNKPPHYSQSLWRQILDKWRHKKKKCDILSELSDSDKNALNMHETVFKGEEGGMNEMSEISQKCNIYELSESVALLDTTLQSQPSCPCIAVDTTTHDIKNAIRNGHTGEKRDSLLRSTESCQNSLRHLSGDKDMPLAEKLIGSGGEFISNGYTGYKANEIIGDTDCVINDGTLHFVSSIQQHDLIQQASFSKSHQQIKLDSLEKDVDVISECEISRHSGTHCTLNNNDDLCPSEECPLYTLNSSSKEHVAQIPTQHTDILTCRKLGLRTKGGSDEDRQPCLFTRPLSQRACTGNRTRSETLWEQGFFPHFTHSSQHQQCCTRDGFSVRRINSSPEIFSCKCDVSILQHSHYLSRANREGTHTTECDSWKYNGFNLHSNRRGDSMLSKTSYDSQFPKHVFPLHPSISLPSPLLQLVPYRDQLTYTKLYNKERQEKSLVSHSLKRMELTRSEPYLFKNPVKTRIHFVSVDQYQNHCPNHSKILPDTGCLTTPCILTYPLSSHAESFPKEGTPCEELVGSDLKHSSEESSVDSSKSTQCAESDTSANITAVPNTSLTPEAPNVQEMDKVKEVARDISTLAPPFTRPRSALRSTGSVSSRDSSKTPTFADPPHRFPSEMDSCLDDDDEIFSDEPTDVFFAKWKKIRAKAGSRISRNSRNSRNSRGSTRSNSSRKRFARERQMTLMLLSVTAAFLLAWIPPWIIYLIYFFGPYDLSDFRSPHLTVFRYAGTVHLVNFVASPLIYYIFNPTYRSKVKGLLAPVNKLRSRCFMK